MQTLNALFCLIGLFAFSSSRTNVEQYNGYIAVETFNVRKKGITDANDVINVTNCRGFVLFQNKVDNMNFVKAFFPLSFCHNGLNINHILENNEKYYDAIFDEIRVGNSKEYQNLRDIKGEGLVTMNYQILRVELKYKTVVLADLEKYVIDGKYARYATIKSNICEIVELKILPLILSPPQSFL